MRPIGINILKVCEALDGGERLPYRSVNVPDMEPHFVRKYLIRACNLGFATFDGELFEIIPGWRERSEGFAPRRVTRKPPARMINSVWQLGAQ